MNVLAIETSAIYCSIAVFKDGQIFFKEDTNKSQHGKVILALIDELLDQSQLSLEQLDKILISYGPGSFTGLRIGCGVAQSFNLIHRIKCFGISSLKVLASTAYQNELKGKIVCLISLGMGEFAASKFDDKDSLLDNKTEEFILLNEDLATFLKEHNLILKEIWLTHGHWDHIAGVSELSDADAKVVGHHADKLLFENPQLMSGFSLPGVSGMISVP